jgi:predicted phosphodiesterase
MPAGKERVAEIVKYIEQFGETKASADLDLKEKTLKRYVQYANKMVNKKVGEFNWREWVPNMQERQRLHEKASWSQDSASITIKTDFPCIVYKPLADNHIGDIGCDYNRLLELTDLVKGIPYLYISLTGDDTDNFVSFKNQLPMLSQILSPEEQDEFLLSWLDEIKDKILFSGWGNHQEFEEKVSARSSVKNILNRNLIYFNGIGICNLQLNEQKYKIVSTHTTRYSSSFNKTHGLKQLARKDIPDADIYIAGHVHDPAQEYTYERGVFQLFMVLGSLKMNDGYSKRWFSYFTAQKDGAVVLDTQKHRFIPYPCLEDALEYAKLRNGC